MAAPFIERVKSLVIGTKPTEVVAAQKFDPESYAEAYARASHIIATNGTEKNFDWYHYQAVTQAGMTSAYQNEFNNIPTVRVLKSLYIQEPWVASCMNAISRQFMPVDLMLKYKTSNSGEEKIIKRHPFLDFMNTAGDENRAFFTSNNILDLCLTGNNYWWISKDLKTKERLPAERVDPFIKDNKVINYRVMNDGGAVYSDQNLVLDADEVVHLKMPNPFSKNIGLGMLLSLSLPVLIDKYGREYIIGFFLRGGNTSGIIQTETKNGEQLLAFAKTLMQAFGGRRNMHADKILPAGAKWAGQGNSFSDIKLMELLKDNINLFKSLTGCTNTVLGLVESVNYATAKAELELFWKMTIQPLQFIYCAGIMSSPLWARFNMPPDAVLCFDNSSVEWLDTFQYKLDQDKLLASSWTINERRERLGKPYIERLADKLELELKSEPKNPGDFGLQQQPGGDPGADGAAAQQSIAGADAKAIPDAVDPKAQALANWKSAELDILKPNTKSDRLFAREFGAWEGIVMDNLKSKDAAKKAIQKRSEAFAKKFADAAMPGLIKAYANQLAHAKKAKSFAALKTKVVHKDAQQEIEYILERLEERARKFMRTDLEALERRSFQGFSDTQTERVYGVISEGLKSGKSLADIGSDVRMSFEEFYDGQANTIVQTEYGAAVALGQKQFASDLATVANKMSKTWVTMEDKFVREDHKSLDGQTVEGSSSEINDLYFELDGDDYLTMPRISDSDAGKVINCRCSVQFDVLEWSENPSLPEE